MELTVGAVLEGKVRSITGFGAFVALPDNKTGMIHISEVSNTYVNDIREHLTEGQTVQVMVIGLENGKVNLSMKRLQPKQPRRDASQHRESQPRQHSARSAAPTQPAAPKTADQLFEEKLKQFMAESDSKISSIKQYSDRRPRTRRK